MKIFIKNNKGVIILFLLNFMVLFSLYNLMGGFEDFSNFIYFMLLSIFNLLVYLILKYLNERKMYKSLEKKPEVFEDCLNSFGDSTLGKYLNEYTRELYSIYKFHMHENIKKQTEHLDFINQWVHQMKTPLSVIKLIIQENGEQQCIKDIKEETEKLEEGLNIALYNARLENFHNDFNVAEFDLKELVLDRVNYNKKLFIKNGVFPKVEMNNIKIKSDKKWISFILDQIIINGVKYSKGKGKLIEIKAGEQQKRSYIYIKDEGIGIPKKDINRVMEPFYTGENGRIFGESTGMGLYITNEVCKKLNHELEIQSNEGEGTKITIYFN
ncbi:HAMP domain-containing histidine kinase [Clostridium botulinum]|nr:HAMP domain-containing histidine kinase [Clostridium botulinum]